MISTLRYGVAQPPTAGIEKANPANTTSMMNIPPSDNFSSLIGFVISQADLQGSLLKKFERLLNLVKMAMT